MPTHDEWDTETGLQLLSSAGIDWLPDGWTVRQLGPMLADERGVSVGVMYPGENTAGGIPLIRAGELTGSIINDRPEYRISPEVHHEYRRTALEGGELLITLVGEVGLCAVVPNSMRGWNAARALAVVRLADPSEAAFVRLCLISPPIRHLMHVWCNTTVQATLNLKDLRLLPVPWPPVADREAIVRAIGSLDDKIEQNRRTGRALEALARATFKAWFVDFEPVKAKAAGATSFPGMPAAVFATLPTRLIDSELGPVPEGWSVSPIGDVVTVKGGGTPSTKDDSFWADGIHHWATPKDFSDLSHPVLLSTERRITNTGLAKISSGLLPIDTVLMSSRAPVGYLALAKVPTAINQGFIAIQCDGLLKSHFVLHWLASVMEEIKGRASGTTFAEISKTAFRPIPVVVPTAPVIEAFENFARPIFDLITQGVKESEKLATLRDYLLPRLLSGKVRVGI